MVILDTSIIIDHIRQIKSDQDTLLIKLASKLAKQNLGISILTFQELYQGTSTRDIDDEIAMLKTVSEMTVFEHTYNTAKLAGQIYRDYQIHNFADNAIAATAITHNLPLATLDSEHFCRIEGLELFDLGELE